MMMTKLNSLEPLFFHTLKDIYSVENQVVQALPKMASAASLPDLQRGFLDHLEQTKGQIARIEKIFSDREEQPGENLCPGMQGILEEVQDIIRHEDITPQVRDAGLVAVAQKIEHYEIAAYGTARSYALLLGFEQDAQLLEQSLDEEARTNEKLTALAEAHINNKAVSQEKAAGDGSV